MLWVFKRTISMRRFFLAPKRMFKLMGKKMFAILRSKILFIWTYGILFILIDYPKHIDTICVQLSILYLKGLRLPVKISIK